MLTEDEVLELIGDPEQAARETEAFSRSAQFFSSNHTSFVKKYPDKWVAVHGDDVLAADTLEALFGDLKRKDIPRGQAVIRFVTPKKRLLIL